MPQLEGLRALFALGIVAFHAWMFTRHPGDPPVGRFVGELRIGVVLFFALSGFLLWRSCVLGRRPALRAYALGRAARILPLYWLTLAVSAVLLAGTGYGRAAELHEAPALILLLQNYFDLDGLLNPPAWTLVVEVSFYAAMPALAWMAVRTGAVQERAGRARRMAVPIAALGLGLAYCLVWELAGWERHWLATLPGCLTYFAAGMLAAAWLGHRRPGAIASWSCLAGGVVLVAANARWHAEVGALGQGLWRDTLAALGFAAIIAAVGPGGRASWLAWAPLQALGRWSYGIYLWHFVAMAGWLSRGAWPPDFWSGFAILLAVSVPLASFTYRFVERPVIAWSRARNAPAPEGEDRRRGRPHARPAGSPSTSRRARSHAAPYSSPAPSTPGPPSGPR
jgi:peptidoglycan/LPS O-acetylase OafA/YrhL